MTGLQAALVRKRRLGLESHLLVSLHGGYHFPAFQVCVYLTFPLPAEKWPEAPPRGLAWGHLCGSFPLLCCLACEMEIIMTDRRGPL